MARPGRATLGDVARRAGVSDITVSRVVRGQGPVAAGTRERGPGVIQALGRIANRSASALASRSSPWSASCCLRSPMP